MAKRSSVPPYYFPTTVIFIDDDESFLNNLSVCLPSELAFRTYSNPHKALQHIAEIGSDQPVSEQCIGNIAPSSNTLVAADSVTFSLTPITDALYTEQRFSEVSVVVIDYDMPSINGLEVCARLADSPVKKLLLTGKADEKVAVEAFNDGLIDRFISKGQPDMIDGLASAISNLQRDYFAGAAQPVAGILRRHNFGFLSNPAFATRFRQLTEQHGWVEHYLSSRPPGLLCLSADGRPAMLLIADTNTIEDNTRRAHALGSPPELLKLIASGEVIADLPVTDSRPADWHQCLHLTLPAADNEAWRITIIDKPQGLKYEAEQLYNYRYYLEILHYIEHQLKGG